jgi:hypothetical protein
VKLLTALILALFVAPAAYAAPPKPPLAPPTIRTDSWQEGGGGGAHCFTVTTRAQRRATELMFAQVDTWLTGCWSAGTITRCDAWAAVDFHGFFTFQGFIYNNKSVSPSQCRHDSQSQWQFQLGLSYYFTMENHSWINGDGTWGARGG